MVKDQGVSCRNNGGSDFEGKNIPTITSCDHCKIVQPLDEGTYDPDADKITINEYDFEAGNLWSDRLSNSEAKALLSTHLHEMIHANQNWISQAIIKYLSNDSGDGIGDKLHDYIDKMADVLAEQYADEYNERREKEKEKEKECD